MTNDAQNLGIHPDQHALAFGGGVTFIGDDGGLMRTSGAYVDASSQCDSRGIVGQDLVDCHAWLSAISTRLDSLNDGLATLQFNSLSINHHDPFNDIMGGTQDNGTWAFGGKSWFESVGGDGGQSGVDAVNPKIRMHTYAGAQGDVNFNGTLVDPESGLATRDQVIIVEDRTIKAVGTKVAIPPGATVIDLSGATALPGFIDAHTHLCANIDPKWDLGDFWIHAIQWPTGYRALLGAHHAREMLEAGFTTVRDVGNAGDYADRDLEKAIRFGIAEGPTMIFAGRIIGPFGGQFWDTPADRSMLNNPEYNFADSHDEMRREIRENIYFGARVIKVLGDTGQKYAYSEDDLRFIVQEARAAGVPVAVHVQTERGAHNAVAAGAASIEHAWKIADEDLKLAKKNGVALASTDFPERILRSFGMDEDRAKKLHARYVDRLRRAYKEGVTLVYGTDLSVDIPGENRGALAASYVDSYLEAGVPAKVILQAMTTNAARLLGVEKERGSIRAGLAADIVAIQANPLDDITAVKRVVFVMRNGEVVRR